MTTEHGGPEERSEDARSMQGPPPSFNQAVEVAPRVMVTSRGNQFASRFVQRFGDISHTLFTFRGPRIHEKAAVGGGARRADGGRRAGGRQRVGQGGAEGTPGLHRRLEG